MLQTKKLAAIAVIVALFTGDLILLHTSHNGALSWPTLWPYLLVWAAIAALSAYSVLHNDHSTR